mmetsp:Transcript_6434/g.27082  ORF Transcript_6434/g.27082 Transcript_6434/m.27082 type:complete len:202 (+) Transcript_6434:104-709(+)
MIKGALEIEMDRRRWRRRRDAPEDIMISKREALRGVALTLLSRGQFDAGESLYEEASRGVPEALMLPSHIDRAQALKKAGRPCDALEILTGLPTMMVPSQRTEVRVAHSQLMSGSLADVGRIDEALPYAAEAVDLARTCPAEVLLEAMSLQAQIFAMIGRFDDAKAMLGHVLAGRTRLLGPDHEHTRNTQAVLRDVEAASA